MSQIISAMLTYHDAYGTLPPAYIADANGKPMHSWRVLILPYMDETALYQRYRFWEPWNSAHNLSLAAQMPELYRCSNSSRSAETGKTSYFVCVGAHTAFPFEQTSRIVDSPYVSRGRVGRPIVDGAANTILLLEDDSRDVCWLDPRDLPEEELAKASTLPFRSNDPRGACVGFADREMRRWHRYPTFAELAPFITINGHENVDRDKMPALLWDYAERAH